MDLKVEAFHASVQALELNLLAYGAELLQFEEPERLYFDDGTQGLRIDPGVGGSFPLMSVEEATFMGRTEKLAIATLELAVDRLAVARAWRRIGTKGPPAAMMEASELTLSVIETYGIDAQDLVDSTWQSADLHERHDDLAYWRSASAVSPLLKRTAVTGYPPCELPSAAPWIAGYCSQTSLNIEAFALSGQAAVYWNPKDYQRYEVRLPSGIPESTTNGMVGKALSEIIDHPWVRRLDGRVGEITRMKNSVRLNVLREEPMRRGKITIDSTILSILDAEKEKLLPGRARVSLLAQRQLTPPDVDIKIHPAVLEMLESDDTAEI